MAQLTANTRKLVASLGSAKHRRDEGLFVAEGTRCVLETIRHFRCRFVAASAQWIEVHRAELPTATELLTASRADLERITHLASPQDVVAVYEIPCRPLSLPSPGELCLALDCIQDPGNLGTIVRIADWFGIERIYCSPDTSDVYNPKTVQATMGALSRVNLYYTPLPELIGKLKADGVPCYGTFLDGCDLYAAPLSAGGLVVMGNEGRGVSPEVAATVDHRLLIPSFPPDRPTVESLNVSMATAITVAEFRRRMISN